MSDLTNEQIEKYRKIVKNAPENAESYDLCWERYILDYDYDYSGEDLDMLKAIIAQHDRIAELERERDKRDIEQQIKGIGDAIAYAPSKSKYRLPLVETTDLYDYQEQLKQKG